MDVRTKKFNIGQNIYLCKFGALKNLPLLLSLKNCYNSSFNCGQSTTFCDVYIKPLHPLILAKEFVMEGMNPVLLMTVTKDFNGSNLDSSEGIHDELINLRTNFHRTIMLPSGTYPIKGTEVVYTPFVTIIRDEMHNIMNPQSMYKVSLIVTSPINDPKLRDESFELNDYFKTKEIIETIFQTAILRNHDVLILTDFGCKYDKNPLKDIVDIFNLSILKYGHLFKYIVFAFNIREQTDMAYYAYFSKEIIKPQEL